MKRTAPMIACLLLLGAVAVHAQDTDDGPRHEAQDSVEGLFLNIGGLSHSDAETQALGCTGRICCIGPICWIRPCPPCSGDGEIETLLVGGLPDESCFLWEVTYRKVAESQDPVTCECEYTWIKIGRKCVAGPN